MVALYGYSKRDRHRSKLTELRTLEWSGSTNRVSEVVYSASQPDRSGFESNAHGMARVDTDRRLANSRICRVGEAIGNGSFQLSTNCS